MTEEERLIKRIRELRGDQEYDVPNLGHTHEMHNGNIVKTVMAFELENKLRNLFRDVMEPVVLANRENHKRLAHLENLTSQIDKETSAMVYKLDHDKRLRDVIDDNYEFSKKVKKDMDEDMYEIKTKLGSLSQLMNTHEDKLMRLTDEKSMYVRAKD